MIDSAIHQHPTIRRMVGAIAGASIVPEQTAVLVIDFQNEYFAAGAAAGLADGRMVIPDGVAALQQSKQVLAFADQHGIAVIHVQHVLPGGAPLFAEGSHNVAFHVDMQPRSGEVVIRKDTVSVFAGESAAVIDAELAARGIQTLILVGLQTHACISGAARDAAAAPRGHRVIVVSDATADRALQLETGASIDHRSLHMASLATLEDTFGEVLTTAQLLELPTAVPAAAA